MMCRPAVAEAQLDVQDPLLCDCRGPDGFLLCPVALVEGECPETQQQRNRRYVSQPRGAACTGFPQFRGEGEAGSRPGTVSCGETDVTLGSELGRGQNNTVWCISEGGCASSDDTVGRAGNAGPYSYATLMEVVHAIRLGADISSSAPAYRGVGWGGGKRVVLMEYVGRGIRTDSAATLATEARSHGIELNQRTLTSIQTWFSALYRRAAIHRDEQFAFSRDGTARPMDLDGLCSVHDAHAHCSETEAAARARTCRDYRARWHTVRQAAGSALAGEHYADWLLTDESDSPAACRAECADYADDRRPEGCPPAA